MLRQQSDFEKRINDKMEGFASIIVGLQSSLPDPSSPINTNQQDVVEQTMAHELEDDSTREDGRQDVIGEGGSGAAAYSLRYRNDGATGVHRLEWIAKATALDPDTGLPWPDDEWNEVLNGDAEIYVP